MDERWLYRQEMKAALAKQHGNIDRALDRLAATRTLAYHGASTQGWTATPVFFVFKRRKQ